MTMTTTPELDPLAADISVPPNTAGSPLALGVHTVPIVSVVWEEVPAGQASTHVP
jgi:hypothetical protein